MRGLSTVPREACSQASSPGPLGELRSPAPRRPRSSERRGQPLELPSGNTGLCFHLVPAERRGSFPPRVPVSVGTVPRHSEHSVKAFDNEAHLTTNSHFKGIHCSGQDTGFPSWKEARINFPRSWNGWFPFLRRHLYISTRRCPRRYGGCVTLTLFKACPQRPLSQVPLSLPRAELALDWPEPRAITGLYFPEGLRAGLRHFTARAPVLAPSRGPPQAPQAQPF